jgi:hypothetical protein
MMGEWLEHARVRSVVVRAARTSALVGTILVAINQGDVLLAAGLGAISWSKIALTYFVPYAVSTSASVASRRELGGSASIVGGEGGGEWGGS